MRPKMDGEKEPLSPETPNFFLRFHLRDPTEVLAPSFVP